MIATEKITEDMKKYKTLYIPVYYTDAIFKDLDVDNRTKSRIVMNSTKVTDDETKRVAHQYKEKTGQTLSGKVFKTYIFESSFSNMFNPCLIPFKDST